MCPPQGLLPSSDQNTAARLKSLVQSEEKIAKSLGQILHFSGLWGALNFRHSLAESS
jgi:hypothetical protein